MISGGFDLFGAKVPGFAVRRVGRKSAGTGGTRFVEHSDATPHLWRESCLSSANRAILRRYFEQAWNNRDLAVLDEIVSPDYLNHNPAAPGLPGGVHGLKIIIGGFRAAFPDLRFTIEDQIAEGDKVVTRWTMLGTHRGEFMGIAATNKQVQVAGMQVERVVDGKIVEHWRQSDDLGLLQQLVVVAR